MRRSGSGRACISARAASATPLPHFMKSRGTAPNIMDKTPHTLSAASEEGRNYIRAMPLRLCRARLDLRGRGRPSRRRDRRRNAQPPQLRLARDVRAGVLGRSQVRDACVPRPAEIRRLVVGPRFSDPAGRWIAIAPAEHSTRRSTGRAGPYRGPGGPGSAGSAPSRGGAPTAGGCRQRPELSGEPPVGTSPRT